MLSRASFVFAIASGSVFRSVSLRIHSQTRVSPFLHDSRVQSFAKRLKRSRERNFSGSSSGAEESNPEDYGASRTSTTKIELGYRLGGIIITVKLGGLDEVWAVVELKVTSPWPIMRGQLLSSSTVKLGVTRENARTYTHYVRVTHRHASVCKLERGAFDNNNNNNNSNAGRLLP